jgi:uncharacterized protein YjbJ (UPF0337 family)
MAINVQTIQGEWTHLCGLARQRWSQLTDDDLGALEGNFEQLVGRIQQKTGEGREAIVMVATATADTEDPDISEHPPRVGQRTDGTAKAVEPLGL